MLFKKIEMHGFKSFAEPVTIEFNEGITGIVGPNGSGKSNISDAIRWVLGEQSPKMLRGGKMEEVIFNGTDSRKSRGMAEVTLTIDNSDLSLPIDYKEVAITRRMFRSGESEYHINGNQCRLRDIRELIMDTGIGVEGYSLIGQGKISDIISNKTESRREIFEEAAGIVAYRTKKAEAERKLASTTANMDRIQDIIGEIEGRIDGLREDSAKAKEYLELSERYKELEINIVLKNIESLESKNEYAAEDLRNLAYSIEKLEAQRLELEEKIGESAGRSEALETLSVEGREKLLLTIDQLNALVNKGQLDKERIATIEENEERLRSELEALEEKRAREEANGAEFIKEKVSIDEEAAEADRSLREKIEEFNDISAHMASLGEEADSFKNEMFELNSAINSAKAEISSLKHLQETMIRRQQALQAEKGEGAESNRETLDELNIVRKEREETAEIITHKKAELQDKKARLDTSQEEERRITRETEELRINLSRLSARKKTIEEMESNYEGYNNAVRHIMKSGLSGIHGVVAELIEVPRGYETAIETALGATIQNVVCEDDSSAKRAIKLLKENKAGRMTFLPLKSIKAAKNRNESLKSRSGFVGFGPDCVRFDHRYDKIFEYLLGRVVIVDNMDNAVKLSKNAGGMRIVTLEGEIINAGGAITGGRYKNKTANILDRKAEIAQLTEELNSGIERQKNSETRLEQLRGGIRKLSEEIGTLELEIREDEQNLMIKDGEIRLAENVLVDIRNSGDKVDRELESIATEQERSAEMIAKLEEGIRANQKAIERAEALSSQKLDEVEAGKAEFDKISEEITAARIQVRACEERKAHADDLASRIEVSVREIQGDIESRREALKALNLEKREKSSVNGDIDELIKAKEAEKQKAEEMLAEITKEKATLTATLSELNQEKDVLGGKVSDLQNQKYQLDLRKAKNETQLDTYKEKLWEDFEISYIQAMEFRSDEFVMSSAVKENRKIKNRIKELGQVNVGAIEEYETVKERYDCLSGQQKDVQEAMDHLGSIISDMDKTIRVRFKESFDQIVINFEEQFRILFGGGHAELRLSDENNPLESNIDIVAQPPGKKLQNINLLSGGEKSLTAIALMFAVLRAKPTPFCILDEVEAALDDANIGRFIECLRQFNNIQFTLVTHQKATMEQTDVLYGVTMPEKGVSKVLSLSMSEDLSAYAE